MSILEVLYDIFTYVFLVFFPVMAVLGVVVCCEFVRWLRFDMKQPSSYEIVLSPSDNPTATPSVESDGKQA